MADKKGDGDKNKAEKTARNDNAEYAKEKLEKLYACDKVLSEDRINHALVETVQEEVEDIDENMCSSDEIDEDLEDEYHRLNEILDLPEDTYSLTKINLDLPPCIKFGIRSGLTHLNMSKFSPLSRGLQGPAIAIAAYATTSLVKARCWNEFVIDQIVEDGDTYYCESYKNIITDDRRTLTILDLKRKLTLQNTHYVHLNIDDPAYAGTFRSQNPTEMHLVKALELFFKKYDAGVLTSSKLNLAIWKDAKYFNIFDGQARGNNCEPVTNNQGGAAKLILVRNLTGVVFIILEKSNVTNEPFVLFGIAVASIYKIPLTNDDPDEPEKSIGKPKRRPSGYKIQAKFRALVQGSYHLMHSAIPKELQGRGHLVIALSALIYSRLVRANKWTSAMIDLIFNQAHVYMVDLVRVLGKKLNETLELKIDDLMGDVVLGVYAAKIRVEVNVVPGEGKKGKATIDAGIRDFFRNNISGILEIKKIFYAIWKDGNKYYLLDPFACDHEGFRVDPDDPEDAKKYETAVACVTMNSSINEIIETILENTGCKEKDPFVVHGMRVLYVKTGTIVDGPLDRVIYREKNTNRRPQPLPNDIPRESLDETECKTVLDMIPKPRFESDKIKDKETQFPELMHNVEHYMMKEDEPTSFIEGQPEDSNTTAMASLSEKEVKYIKGYDIVNPHRLLLQGWKNCFSEEFDERSRGRQGLIIALTAIAYGKVKHPSTWRNIDVNQIIDVGHKTYEDTIMWIRQGRPEEKKDTEERQEERNEGEINEVRKKDKGDDGDKGDYEEDVTTGTINIEGNLQLAPSHLDLSMLSDKMKLGENEVIFKKKMDIVEGNADPLVNLGEALEYYFTYHDELIVENKRLMYGVWKTDGKFFLFNPYGSDEEGQRIRGFPASFAITSSVNELIDLFYRILEYNESRFSFHFIGIESIQPDNKYLSPNPIHIPEGELVDKYETIFLPVTDEDLSSLTQILEPETSVPLQDTRYKLRKGDEDEEKEGKEVDEVEEKRKAEKKSKDEETEEEKEEQLLESEKSLKDPLLEVEEGEQPDAPERLNLSLLTGNVNFEEENEEIDEELMEALTYEKLKYKHPPPYVRPPKDIICTLLKAKRASKSVHSLVSRFSIDSKLAVKQRSDLPAQPAQESTIAAVNVSDGERPSKLIKLSSRKYVISRIPPSGFMPLRAINDKFIQDENLDRVREEECKRRKREKPIEDLQWEEVPNVPTEIRIGPTIIPLGPTIKTLTSRNKLNSCSVSEKRKRKCRLLEKDREDAVLEKIVCKTEDVLFNMMFSNSDANVKEIKSSERKKDSRIEGKKKVIAGVRMKDSNEKPKEPPAPELYGFKGTDENVSVIEGNMCLENRLHNEEYHFKQCYFTAILCILAKVQMDVKYFRGSILDQFILAGDKMYQYTGKLRYKLLRWFYNVIILGMKYNVILKQVAYADPDSWEEDNLLTILTAYLTKYQTGILVFSNVSYAFWYSNDKYYLFDSYACDDKGHANESGFACLMQFVDLSTMLKRIQENTGEESARKPYRIYALAVVHVESLKHKTKKRKEVHLEEEPEEDHYEPSETVPVLSLIELAEWIVKEKRDKTAFDTTIPGFAAIPNFIASSLEVIVLENNVTTPILTELKSIRSKQQNENAGDLSNETLRKRQRNRTFKEHTANISEPIDLCIMAWAHIHDPTQWGTRTVKGIFEASKDFTFDCLLALEDTTLDKMTDGVLPEFTVANYTFRAVFAPLHHGTLYATVGWNLAMSLKKVFNTPIYSGAILVCGKAHIGTMRKNKNYYAWWTVPRTKNLKIITSEEIEDLLKLIVMEINEPYETEFFMRVITISYAQKMDPDCDDTAGLHEKMVPTTSLPEIHRKRAQPYDIEAIFRKTIPSPKPIFVQGSVALRNCDVSKEPKVKRCYFVAILVVMVKRDVMQSTVPGMIDKIIEVAEGLYKEFKEPKYHTEHILRNVTVMNRIFEFRDCASPFVAFEGNPTASKSDRYLTMRKYLKRHFKKHTDGIIHFTNCCYGFWYSRSTNSYYYLNPYQCDAKGRSVLTRGKSCLCIFSSICHMTKHMCQNQSEDTTGFFIHQLHVESINVPPCKKFQEDPMWVYLDFHWSFSHAENNAKAGKKKQHTSKASKQEKPSWNDYAIEVPNLIYSVWGTIGCYDSRFGDRAGRNQAAICVALLAMQYLCHPSQWSPAILDSAVICGDCYYTESLKSTVRKGCRHQNRFNLQSRFKVFPHVWTIEFKRNMCGTLYGGRSGMTLATTLKLAFEEAPNVIIECNGATFSVLVIEDGYYVADPRWTGLPLFSKNHGALYVLRCRNTNALVYALTKMLNTNQRLGFHVTPVSLTFSHELCKLGGEQVTMPHKRILVDPVGTRPGRSNGPVVPVPLTSPDEDSYLRYRRNLTMGIRYGEQLENPTVSSSEPKLRDVNLNNVEISTTWHLNIGHSISRKRTKGAFGSLLVKLDDANCGKMSSKRNEPLRLSTVSCLEEYGYPRTIDFMEDVRCASLTGPSVVSSELAESGNVPETIVGKPMDCAAVRNFFLDRSQGEFLKQTEEMADKNFTLYQHRVPLEQGKNEADTIVVDEIGNAGASESEEPPVAEEVAS